MEQILKYYLNFLLFGLFYWCLHSSQFIIIKLTQYLNIFLITFDFKIKNFFHAYIKKKIKKKLLK